MRARTWRAPFVALSAALLAVGLLALVPASTATAAVDRDVLLLGVDDPSWLTDVQGKLQSTGSFSTVDIGDAATTTPTLAQLRPYDAVLVWSDGPFADPAALGDVLADYADAGGQVAVATFALNDDSFGLTGRLNSGGYLPLTPGPQVDGVQLQMVKDDPSSPLLAGVTSFDGGPSSYHAAATLAPGGHLVAHWNDVASTPLEAVKVAASGAPVVGLNMFPPSSDARNDFWDVSTAGARLMANALLPLVTPVVAQQPDGWVRKHLGRFHGNDVYNTTGARQTIHGKAYRTGNRTYWVRIYDDGKVAGAFTAHGTESAHGVRVRYFSDGKDVTAAMHSVAGLSFTRSSGGYISIRVRVHIKRHAAVGAHKFAKVTATSTGAAGVRVDAVRAIVKVR